MEAWRRCIYVHPFHEEDVAGLVGVIGADNVLFGSDYPHPEGLFDPVTFIDELDTLSTEDQRKIMGANLAKVMGIDHEPRLLVSEQPCQPDSQVSSAALPAKRSER